MSPGGQFLMSLDTVTEASSETFRKCRAEDFLTPL